MQNDEHVIWRALAAAGLPCGAAPPAPAPHRRAQAPTDRPPVCALLSQALLAAGAGPCAQLAAAIAVEGLRLRWRRNAGYPGRLSERFLAGYAYAELIGSEGPYASEDLAAGVLLLGPELHYPLHAHPAHERYLCLTAGASFQVGGVRRDALAAGALVDIPSQTPHAMQTGAAPLLAVYRWTGELSEPARLLDP